MKKSANNQDQGMSFEEFAAFSAMKGRNWIYNFHVQLPFWLFKLGISFEEFAASRAKKERNETYNFQDQGMSFEEFAAFSAKTGGNWTYKIYFLPEADKIFGSQYEIEDEELFGKLLTLLDVNETVDYVWAYKHDLFPGCPMISICFFICLYCLKRRIGGGRSKRIHSEGLTIQRSKVRDAVQNNYRRDPRPSPTVMAKDTGRRSIMNFIAELFKCNEMNNEYHYLESNCQGFASDVFNYLADDKTIRGYDRRKRKRKRRLNLKSKDEQPQNNNSLVKAN